MLRNWKLWSACLAFVFLAVGCGPTAHIEKDDNTDFSRYKTFAWLDKDDKGHKTNDLTEQRIRKAVNDELLKKGWRESNDEAADVLLSYDVLVERSSRTESDPVYTRPFTRTFYNPYRRRFINVYYPSQFVGYDTYNVPTREGTVTISMIDANTEKTVWQGWATEQLDSRNISSKEINSTVKAIMKKLPKKA
ncbi:DUF4136 domain-containing protein [Nostoc ellipsosporum NOK]|jgi:hypothetical protein|nr:DUF4136 domain-containing protein [Nostoc ellipsosporum NOK]